MLNTVSCYTVVLVESCCDALHQHNSDLFSVFSVLLYVSSVHGQDVAGINSKRFAEVWLDDYKQYFYQIRWDMQVRRGKDRLLRDLGMEMFWRVSK